MSGRKCFRPPQKRGKKSNSSLFLCVPCSFQISSCPLLSSSEKKCHYACSFGISNFLSGISAPFQILCFLSCDLQLLYENI